jgi:hypothetical protein
MGALRLRKIEIQGFRSFGSVRQTINLPDTVTALWGGNSQGKTSFAEAMEFLITGQIARRELLASAKDEFSDSLRNAHIAPAIAVIVEAEFVCPDGKHRRLKRTLVEDYKGSSLCSSKVEIDGKPCAEADLESQIGLKLLKPPLRAPVLSQQTLGYVFSASPTDRAAYFRAILDTQDLEDFRTAVAALAPRLIAPTLPELESLSAIEAIPELAATAAKIRASKSEADVDATVLANLSALLVSLNIVPKGSLSERAAQLDEELESRRKRTFPLALFGRKPFSSWGGPPAELEQAIQAFDRERLAIDVETRRLVTLFESALALPSISDAHDPLDCPLCGAESTLTPERIGHIRAQVTANANYQRAEKVVTQALRALDGSLNTLEQTTTQALPKFAQLLASNRRAEGFTIRRIQELATDAASVLVWTKAARSLMRASRVLTRSTALARSEISGALNAIGQWATSTELVARLEHVLTAQSVFEVAQQAYAAPIEALSEPLKAAVDQGTHTKGWEALIAVARDTAKLWSALLLDRAHALKVKNLENALKDIDVGNGKVADEKFDDLSDEVKLWWERLRPDEPAFFNAVQRRGAKTRRTIDLKVGLSAKDDRSDPKFRDAIAVFSQSQLHCLGLSLFLARAIEEKTGFIVLDDPVLTSDDDFRPNFASTVIEELLAAGMEILVLTQDHASWKDIGHRWEFRGVAQLQMVRNDPVVGTEIRNQNDTLATMIAKTHPFINSQDGDQRKQGAIQLRQVIERFGKEVLVRHRRASGELVASITDYDGQNFGTFSGQVLALLTQDRSHPGKLTAAHSYVTPGPHDDTPPSKGQLKVVIGDLKRLKKDYLD